ncbi:MAG: hypothetical protein LIO56_01040 [Lachnospiraceae bacterium]|nr:hypothetical protein [Lachnospiraceae bacterium]
MRKKQVLALVVTVSVIAFGTTACESLTGIAGGQSQDTTEDTAQDAGSLAEADAQDVVEEEKPEEQPVEEEIVVEEAVVINNNEITPVQNEDTVSVYGLIGSWTGGGQNVDENDGPDQDEDNDYLYTGAIVDIGGDIETYTNEGLYEGDVTAQDATNVEITDTEAGHNGIILVDAGNYEITHATITMETEADGTTTCDFSGQGSALLVSGDTYARITDALVSCKGVATMPVFTDNGATTLINDSTLISEGGTLYGDYMNSPEQATMVAPPWILGIMGTSRASNLMGDDSTMHFVDSTAYAGAWAVLSTDSGSNMYLNICNSTLELLNSNESSAAPLQEPVNSNGGSSQIYETVDNPYTKTYGSGYGTYVIGDAVETFAGSTLNVGTYASVFTGGSATYMGIEEGQSYTLPSAKGDTDYEYTAETSQKHSDKLRHVRVYDPSERERD